MISAPLGMMLSLFLTVLSFFGALPDALPVRVAWLWLPFWLVAVTAPALVLPRAGVRLTYVARFAVPAAALLCLVHGQVALVPPLLLLGLVMWWGSWLALQRTEGRSLGGVARDLRFAAEQASSRLRGR